MNNKIKVMELFPVPVFSVIASEIDNEKLCQTIYKIRDDETADGHKDKSGASNIGGFRTYDFLSHPGFNELKQYIVKLINESLLRGQWFADPDITESHFNAMWAVINRRGNANSLHNHPFSWLSGAYYPKVPKDVDNAGDICFRDPIMARTFTRSFYRSVQSELLCVPPEEGKLVLFPSWFEHSVRANNTDDDRIVISFNIGKEPRN